MEKVRLILAVAVALTITVPMVVNSVKGQQLTDSNAASVATLLGAIVAGLFLIRNDDDDDDERK